MNRPTRDSLAAFSLAIVAGLLACPRVDGDVSRPNIVVILVDDMGYGDPGCFNSASKIPTLHIDSLARNGMRFTDAHAPGPLCHMSRYGLITGRYPFRTNVGVWPTQPLIEEGQTTIASLAKEQGYRTAMVGKWHLGFAENGYDQPLPGGPVDCGFDSYFGIRASTDIPPYFYIRGDRAIEPPTNHIEANNTKGWSPIQGKFWRAGGIAPNLQLEEVLPRFTDEAIAVIDTHVNAADKNQPLLLYLAYPAPHTPWLPSDEFVGQSGANLYGDFMMMVDAEIGRVLAKLREQGMDEETLVVFTSDNGPTWYDKDVERYGHDSAAGLRGMKSDAWEAGHRMPFVVRWPGRVRPGSTSDQLICFTDLLATFADLWEADLPIEAGPDSFSFLPSLVGEKPGATPQRTNFVMRAGSVASMMSIRSGDWKLITGLGSGGFSKPNRIKPGPNDPPGQLYNLAQDLAEEHNLYQQHQEIVTQLTKEIQSVIDSGRSRVVAMRVDTSTLKGKVMVGYQGWFNCEGDGADIGWKHWGRKHSRPPGPGNITVDLWPDVNEFDADERYATGFRLPDGSPAEVFSSANRKTVHRHFRWMRDYGIDGAFVQRFAAPLANPRLRSNTDMVLDHVRSAATEAGRAYAVMYDLSGLKAGQVDQVRSDWTRLEQELQLTYDPTYLHHDGRPLVAVWGVGFSDDRDYSPRECLELLEWLKAHDCSVMLGVPSFWREGRRDAIDDPLLHEIIELADVVSPWTIGRYRSPEEAQRHADTVWLQDREWCAERGVDFLPVVFPGFSWHNLKGNPLGQIPRRKGEFFWSQIEAADRIGCDMLYVAMFDEVDEGTAIFKCTNKPPVGDGADFLTYEGLPSDHYLTLAGRAGGMIRENTQESATIVEHFLRTAR